MRRTFVSTPLISRHTLANGSAAPVRFADAVAALQQVTPHGGGVRIDALDEYVKLVCGLEHDVARILPAFNAQMHALLDHLGVRDQEAAASAPLTSPQIHLLALLYFSMCGTAAFSPDGAFDVTGFTAFVAQRLSPSPVATALMPALASEVASSSYAALRCVAGTSGDQLQIGDGEDACFSAPTLSFSDIPSDALKDVYLRRIRLRDRSLRALILEGTDLRDARFIDCRFIDLHFLKTQMSAAHFERCEFENCVLEEVDIKDMRMTRCRIVNSDWSRCNMRNARWRGVELSNTTWQDCDLRGTRVLPIVTPPPNTFDAIFESDAEWLSEMRDCRFERCNWDQAVLLRVQMERSTWRDVACSRARIASTLWQGCWLSGGPLTDTVIRQSRFDDCTLDGLDARETVWNGICLRRTSVSAVNFSDGALTALDCVGPCDFTKALFDSAAIDRMTVSGPVNFTHTSFVGAHLSNVLFLGHRQHQSVDLSFARFSEGNLETVTFQRCQMRNTTFSLAHMQDTVFRGCDLTGADFTRSSSPDLVSVGLQNQLAGATFNGMIPSLNAAVMEQLEDHALRSQFLDPRFADSDAACLTVQIQRFPDFAVRTQLWEILTDHLSTLADDALGDVDPPVLSVLLRPEYANQRALHIYVDSRLTDHLQVFSERGLPLGPERAQDWRRRAVPHICRLLGTMTDAIRLREYSPLIAFLLVAHEHAALTLSHQDRTYLRLAQSLCLPPSLSSAFYHVMNHAPFEAPAYRLFITPRADHAVMVTPDAAGSLLGIRSQPVIPEHSYLYFTRPAPASSDHAEDQWSNEGNQSPATAFAPFPRLRASLSERTARLRGLIATYALPDTLRVPVTEGLLHRIRHPMIDRDAQQALQRVFDPLCTAIPPYSTDSALTEEAHVITHLRPTPDHRRDVLAVLAPGCPDGDNEALGLCAIAYASLMFSAASAAVFGTEYQSPIALRRYGMAWANLGFAVLPSLKDAMPQWKRDANGQSTLITQQELVARCFGLERGESQCAGLIAQDLSAALRAPRFEAHPRVLPLRALLGS